MIPKSLQGVLWSVGVDKLDLKRDKTYIINQILAYGTWVHLKWLFKTYEKGEIRTVFISKPSKDYTRPSFNFVKRHLLGLKTESLDESKYVKTYPRSIG